MDKQPESGTLIAKYIEGSCSHEEAVLVEAGFLNELKNSREEVSAGEIAIANANMRQVLRAHVLNNPKYKKAILWRPYRIAAAAMLLMSLSVGLYFIASRYWRPDAVERRLANYKNDIPAPTDKAAILTLASGRQIDLGKTKERELMDSLGSAAIRLSDGELIYQEQHGEKGGRGALKYHTLTIPRGGSHQLTLADGTRVYLNSASVLKFPASFSALNERRVELTGEAYFVVKHNARQPFRVQTASQLVEDIGTEFNVRNYGDEEMSRMTLVEGSAMVNGKLLVPGERANVLRNKIAVTKADLDEDLAWKNNDFNFNGETIPGIMKILARWYEIEVRYEAQAGKELYYGRISRNKNISEVLTMLEDAQGVHFKIEGRRVTVME